MHITSAHRTSANSALHARIHATFHATVRLDGAAWLLPMSLVLVLASFTVSSRAFAGGFAIAENGARVMAEAYIGGGLSAADASSLWYNPATMSDAGSQVQTSAHLIAPQFEFEDAGSFQQTPGGNLPIGGRTRSDGGASAPVPTFHAIKVLNERWALGASLNAPFGLSTEYSGDWVGRYQTVNSKLVTFNLNLAASYELSERWSVGVGANVLYADAELSSALDFATFCGAAAGGLCPNGALPGAGEFDGFLQNDADDVGYGFNFGIVFRLSPQTRFGFGYRSEVELELTGDVDVSQPQSLGGLAALGPQLSGGLTATFRDVDIKADLTLPDSASLSVWHAFSGRLDGWTLSAEIAWTDWADVPEVGIQFDNPLVPIVVEELGWDDVIRFGFAVNYQLNERWTLRGGWALDQSPTPNRVLRSARVPDTHRNAIAFGARYQYNERISIDVGLSHLYLSDTKLARANSSGSNVVGEFDSHANLFGMQLNWRLL